MSTSPKASKRPYVVAMVLGTALSALGPSTSAASQKLDATEHAVADMSRYCTTCWRNARLDPDFLIMARTDAAATHGFEAAIERAQAFAEAGADILFVEAVTTADEIRALPKRLGPPQLMNLVIGGKTPIFGAEELGSPLEAAACVAPAPAFRQRIVIDDRSRRPRVGRRLHLAPKPVSNARIVFITIRMSSQIEKFLM